MSGFFQRLFGKDYLISIPLSNPPSDQTSPKREAR